MGWLFCELLHWTSALGEYLWGVPDGVGTTSESGWLSILQHLDMPWDEAWTGCWTSCVAWSILPKVILQGIQTTVGLDWVAKQISRFKLSIEKPSDTPAHARSELVGTSRLQCKMPWQLLAVCRDRVLCVVTVVAYRERHCAAIGLGWISHQKMFVQFGQSHSRITKKSWCRAWV